MRVFSTAILASAVLIAGCESGSLDTETCEPSGSGGGGGATTITVEPPTTTTRTIFTCAGCTLDTFDGECMASTADHCGIDGAICAPCSGLCLDGACNHCQKEFCFGADCKAVDIEDGSPCGNDGQCFAGLCSPAP